MSENGEAMFDLLPVNSSIHQPTNQLRKVLDNTVGEWLDNFEDEDFFSQFFLQEATGKYLDLHGKEYGVTRKIDESDEDYRKRIIYESLGGITVNLLREAYNVKLYVFVDDFNVQDNMLTSDNPYIANDGFLGVADEVTQDILNKKFILGHDVVWLVL